MTESGYVIRTGAAAMDVDWLHHRLSTDTYWAIGRSRERVEKLVSNSECYGVFGVDGTQVAFARVVTDSVTFAWLSDVYVDRAARGSGLSSLLMDRIIADCRHLGLRRVLLATDDAAGLYEKFGFESVEGGKYNWMALTWPQHPA